VTAETAEHEIMGLRTKSCRSMACSFTRSRSSPSRAKSCCRIS
jgi:hypothetical protein